MKKYAFRRLLQLIPILFAITFLSYGMMRIAGSDVVTQKMENTGQIVSGGTGIEIIHKATIGATL